MPSLPVSNRANSIKTKNEEWHIDNINLISRSDVFAQFASACNFHLIARCDNFIVVNTISLFFSMEQ